MLQDEQDRDGDAITRRVASPWSLGTALGQAGLQGTSVIAVLANPDTVAGNTSSSIVLAVPGSRNGVIDAADLNGGADADWYRVTLTAGNRYQFDLNSVTLDSVLGIYSAAGVLLQPVTDVFGTGAPEALVFGATTSGVYYIGVSAFNGATLGAFSLRAAIADNVPANTSTQVALAVPGLVSGVIEAEGMAGGGDEDWIRVALVAGTSYRFNLSSITLDGVLAIYDASGNWIYTVDHGAVGDTESLTFSPNSSGSYYLGVYGYQDATVGAFSLSAAILDNVPAGTGTPMTLAAPGSVSGLIDDADMAGGPDQDWYQITLTAGMRYQFNLSSAVVDGILSVYSPAGGLLQQIDDYFAGTTETWTYTPNVGGTYFVGVSAWNAASTGPFTLSASLLDFVPGATSSTKALANPGSVTGTIDAADIAGGADEDWYTVNLAAGTTYQFDLSSLLLDGQLTLYGPGGSMLYGVDRGYEGAPETLVYTTAQAGKYYIAVSGYQGSTGIFQLGVSQPALGGSDTVGGTIATAGAIGMPGHLIGTIDSGIDTDLYAVALTAGTRYQFGLSSYFIDAVLALYDAQGIQQAYADNGLHAGDPESLIFLPDHSGTYYVSVASFGGTTGSFQLDASAYPVHNGDFVGASAGSAASALVPGTTWGEIDRLSSTGTDDSDWYSVRLAAGTTYRVDLSGDSTLDGIITLYGADGSSQLASKDATYQGESEFLYFTPGSTGNYYLAVDGYGGSTGEFLLSVSQIRHGDTSVDTVGDSPLNSGSVAVAARAPGHVDGTINDAADADWYAVALAAHSEYQFNLGSATLDGVLRLYDAQGNQLDYVDNGWGGGAAENLFYTTATAGTYYISASGYEGSTGDFLLDVYLLGSVAHDDVVGDTWDTAASGQMVVGGASVRGIVDSEIDEDVYALPLVANTAYLFDLSSTALDGSLTLYGPGGIWLDSADYGSAGDSESLYFTPSVSGSYYISVGGWSDSTGSFDLRVDALTITGGEVPGNNSSTARLLLPGFVDNQIDPVQAASPSDKDWFSIRLHQGSDYNFYLFSNDGMLDGQLQVFDASGNPVYDQFGNGFADNGWYAGDPESLYFVAPTTADYFVQVSGYDGTVGSYTLYAAAAQSVAAVNWADTSTYANIKWNVLDWVALDAAQWNSAGLAAANASYVRWDELQYEHVYNASAPATPYTGWTLDLSGAANPGNDEVIGGAVNDAVSLGLGLDYFSGGGGNDSASGGGGADSLNGGEGNDTLDGGIGNDAMVGGAGNDTYYVDSPGDVVVEADDSTLAGLNLGSSIDKVVASINYTLTQGVEQLALAAGGAGLSGTGNALNNLINGNNGANALSGIGGLDTLDGGGGNDTLDGGPGADSLHGGLGADVFAFAVSGNGIDSIDDFADGDLIRVAGLNLAGPLAGGDGTALALNRVQVSTSGNVTTLSIGSDAAPGADISIRLSGSVAALQLFAFGTDIGFNHAPSGSVSIAGAINGNAEPGQPLTASNNLADVDTITGSINYQWRADAQPINGATGNSFTPGQAQGGRAITVTASYVDGHGVNESMSSSAVLVPFQGKQVDFIAYSWKAHTLLEAVSISAADLNGSTGADGRSSMGVAVPTLSMGASRSVPGAEANATGAAVNVQDAIDILKMIVGLDVNGAGKPLSPYQSLAADFDSNGAVNVSDAVQVLRHVVGLAAPDPVWHFLNEADMGVPGKAGLNPGVPQQGISADITGNSPVHVGLVGYLSGDVNGSYAGGGTLDLDNTQSSYFTTLIFDHPQLSLTQFGIYPV